MMRPRFGICRGVEIADEALMVQYMKSYLCGGMKFLRSASLQGSNHSNHETVDLVHLRRFSTTIINHSVLGKPKLITS